jgi:2-polyprenyl-3-methyl-5-hydroxy-6-metoxy-1,4-benzoquinol methylase
MDRNTDRDWEEFARTEPYWAVLTHEKFKSDKLTSQSLEDFFRSGEDLVSWTFDQIKLHIDPGFDPVSALDFGCGVGRLTFALARRCRTVTGVDISPGMLEKAREHETRLGISNTTFARADDVLSTVAGPFDFINTYIVLQHIRPERGERLIRRLLDLLRDGGFGALHLTYSNSNYRHDGMHRPPRGVRATFVAFLRALIRPPVSASRRLALALGIAAPREPIMQMCDYQLNRVFHFLQQGGVRRIVVDFTDHGGFYGIVLLFRKDPEQGYRV